MSDGFREWGESKGKRKDLTPLEDFRGLSPLIYNYVNPYGIFELDMTRRLPLEESRTAWAW